jgi:hypothetical protein
LCPVYTRVSRVQFAEDTYQNWTGFCLDLGPEHLSFFRGRWIRGFVQVDDDEVLAGSVLDEEMGLDANRMESRLEGEGRFGATLVGLDEDAGVGRGNDVDEGGLNAGETESFMKALAGCVADGSANLDNAFVGGFESFLEFGCEHPAFHRFGHPVPPSS